MKGHRLLPLVMVVAWCAWAPYLNTSGRMVRWEKEQVDLKADEKGTPDVPGTKEFDAAKKAMATWNRVPCSHPSLFFAGTVSGVEPGEDNGVNLLIFEQHWAYREYQNVIALTTLYYDDATGEAAKVDVEVNDEDYFFTVSDDPAKTSTDVQNALTHEFGHVLGLDHSNVSQATMYYSADPGDLEKRTLHEDDIEGLCTVYGRLPLVASEGEAPDAAEGEAPDAAEAEESSGGGGCNASPTGVRAHAAAVLALLLLAALVLGWQRRFWS